MRARVALGLAFLRFALVGFALVGLCGQVAAAVEPAALPPDLRLEDLLLAQWTSDDGLPSNTLTSVLQTRDGYLWVSSYSGLSRFDGHSFRVFDQETIARHAAPGEVLDLPTDGFHHLAEAADGTLWIGTQGGGVVLYRDGFFRRLAADFNVTVRSLLVESVGGGAPGEAGEEGAVQAWIGTRESGFYRWANGALERLDHPALDGVIIAEILRGADSKLWISTEGEGLLSFDGNNFEVLTRRFGLASDAVSSLAATPDGRLWIGTHGGLNVFEDGAMKPHPDFMGTRIHSLHVAVDGRLWIATHRGLVRFHPATGALDLLPEHDGRPLRSIRRMIFDHEGSLWLSSSTKGLLQLKAGKLVNYSTADSMTVGRVNVAAELSDGRILLGADHGRVYQVAGRELIPFVPPGGPLPETAFAGSRVRTLLEDSRGGLWMGSYAGLLHLGGEQPRQLTMAEGLPTNHVRVVYEDSAGVLWVGTRNSGLVRWESDDRVKIFDRSSGLPSNYVFAIAEGRKGRTWVALNGGLAHLGRDGEIFDLYRSGEDLPGSLVFNVHLEPDGTVWATTDDGLARLARGRWAILDEAAGLPTNEIFDLGEDDQGQLWLTTEVGVLRLERRQVEGYLDGELAAVDVRLFDDSDGMQSRQCTGATRFLKASDGRLWFPTLEGAAVIDPEDIPVNAMAPPVVISRFVADGEDVHGIAGNSIDELLVIEPGTRRFEFDFSVLSYLVPSRLEVRYRLEGFDRDWIKADGRRNVRYTNLDPGFYTFQVIGANNDGTWNEEGASLSFQLRPRFYQTGLFKGLAVLAAAAFVVLLFRWRLLRVRRRTLELERIVAEQHRLEKERQRLIDELEAKNRELERFTYTVSHDLKSPLFTIQGFLGMLESDVKKGKIERVEDDFARIRAATGRMAQMLEELLKLSRIGRVAATLKRVEMQDLTREVVDNCAGRIEERGVYVVIEPGLPPVLGDRSRLLEVLQNLVENGVKFMGDQERPRIEIGLREVGDSVATFFVSDNGIGVDPSYHEKIFTVFDQLDNHGEGTGIGLAIVKRVIEVHGGRVWVESTGRPGEGSDFFFTLPLGVRGGATADGRGEPSSS